MTNAGEIIARLMDEFRTLAKTENVIGEPITIGAYTIIPVTKISVGLGAGAGTGKDEKSGGEGGGGGGGVTVTPVAFIAIKGEDISFHGVKKGGALESLFDAAPEMAEKIMAGRDKTKGKDKEEKKD